MDIMGKADSRVDKEDDILDSDSDYDDEGLDESIPDAEIIGKDPYSWETAIGLL